MKHNGIHKAAYVGFAAATMATIVAMAPSASAGSVLYLGGTCSCNTTSSGADTIANGYLAKRGTTSGIPYYAGLKFRETIPAGGEIALVALGGTDGPVVLAGTSQGALIVHDVERRIMAMPANQRPAKENLSFVVIADEADPFNGILTQFPDLRLFVPATDVESPYDTVSIVREYDGYADFPDYPGNLLATANAVMGVVYLHPDYEDVDINAPGTVVQTKTNKLGGTTTRYTVPTANLPLTQPIRDVEKAITGQTGVTDGVDKVLRPIINTGYKRHETLPTNKKDLEKKIQEDVKKAVDSHKEKAEKHRQESRAAVKDVVKKVDKAVKKALGKDQ